MVLHIVQHQIPYYHQPWEYFRHLNREMSGSGKNRDVRFDEGLPTGSNEMLHATRFYQNCVDCDTESHWMEVYQEQKAGGGQPSSSSDPAEDKEKKEIMARKDKLVTRSTTLMSGVEMITANSTTSLEKTHSAEPKMDWKFETNLQRCQEMENIDKVGDQR